MAGWARATHAWYWWPIGAAGWLRHAPPDPMLPRMPATSLSIVLPAYNEEARLGSALDELFGYLHRRGERARDGRPGAEGLPEQIQVLIVDDGSTDGTAALVRSRRETATGELDLITVPHGGKGAAVRAGM